MCLLKTTQIDTSYLNLLNMTILCNVTNLFKSTENTGIYENYREWEHLSNTAEKLCAGGLGQRIAYFNNSPDK